jgi:hypothetical protein
MANPLLDRVTDALDRGRPDDERETIDNAERGCGHLHASSCYIRSDLAALGSPAGDIPAFVEFDDPVEYREHTGRGAIIPGFKPFPGESFTLHYAADGRSTTPDADVAAHIDRLQQFGFDGDHYADITSTRAIDLLMSVGVSNYDTPDAYIDECRDRGLNLKIPVSSNQAPPVIEPLRTRVFVIHPDGCGDGRPGIIGYAYVTRNVFTAGGGATPDDPDVPGWAEDYATTREDFDVVDRGDPIAADDAVDDAQARIVDVVEDDEGGDMPDRAADDVPTDDRIPIESVDYNIKKAKASSAGIDVGQSPSEADLDDALRDAGITHATPGGQGE